MLHKIQGATVTCSVRGMDKVGEILDFGDQQSTGQGLQGPVHPCRGLLACHCGAKCSSSPPGCLINDAVHRKLELFTFIA